VDLGAKHFKNQADTQMDGQNILDSLSTLTYFRVLMIIGKFGEALDVLSQIDDFKMHATFFAIALNEMNLLRTRYQYLSQLLSNSDELTESHSKESLTK